MKYLALLVLAVSLISCDKNDDEGVVSDAAGYAEYYINNQTDIDLVAIFEKSEDLGSEIDTTEILSAKNSLKILEDAIIGVNPVPADSFMEIKFYDAENLNSEPLLTISPVGNEDWVITGQDFGTSRYGSTIYELILRNENLNQ